MKFKFCSEGDCPLWALAALHALSSLPGSLFKTLMKHVVEEQPDDGIMEILKDTSLSSREECARAAAVIRWVLHQAWRGSCSGAHLTRDLLVLGVPRSHATALAEAVEEGRESYEANVKANKCMINKVTDVSVSPGPAEITDSYKLTLFSENSYTEENRRQELILEKSLVQNLLAELKKAYNKMEELENNRNDIN